MVFVVVYLVRFHSGITSMKVRKQTQAVIIKIVKDVKS